MERVHTLIIGGGQAGLAMSRCLWDRGVDHVVLERGRLAERWRSERWDSLRLLTPNWQTRLPGWSYRGPDPDGYMRAAELTSYLEDYARSWPVPLHTNTTVLCVRPAGGGYDVLTDQEHWRATNVVVATGACGAPHVPAMAASLPADIQQFTPSSYRNPDQLPCGAVLVVGASASGVQLAEELHASGRPVLLCVGRHNRMPRRYRGLDIMWWLDRMGTLTRPVRAGDARDQPSLQLAGRPDRADLDLPRLQSTGIQLLGRLRGIDGYRLHVADDLHRTVAEVDGLVRAGERVSGVRFKGPDGTFHEVGAELVIGADGRSSSVAQLVGASPYRTSRHYTACVYTYVTDVEDQGYRWYYGRRAHGGLIPTNDGAHCAFVLVPPQTLQPVGRRSDPDARFAELAALADPDLPQLLSRARRLEPYRTFTGLPGFLRPAAGPGWALVGDAGYFKDPCTAHGMTDALRDAELLTRAALDGSAEAMATYQRTRDELSLPLFELTDEIASFPRDLDRLREIHIELSRHMQHEARYVAELDARGLAA